MCSLKQFASLLIAVSITGATLVAAASAAPAADACALLTSVQVGAALGAPVGAGSYITPTSKKTCTWNSTTSDGGYVTLMLQDVSGFESGKQLGQTASKDLSVTSIRQALLFLAAGIIIESLHHEHNIFRMGGLRKELPIAFWTFLIAGCSLAGLPLITAGYYSKDLILWSAGSSAAGSTGLWAAGIAGVVLTSLYTFRLIFLVFFGPVRTPVSRRPGLAMTIPVCVLAVLSVVGGFDKAPFARFIATALPTLPEAVGGITETLSSIVAALAFLCGLLGAWFVYQRNPRLATAMVENPAGRVLHRFWFSDWGMDWLYDRLFVRPVVWIARVNKADVVDSIYDGLASLTTVCYRVLSLTETGKLRWYAAWIAGGAVAFVAIVMFL